MELLQIATAYFISKCDGQLLKIATAFLLQIATGITKCDEFITNSNRYYKVRWSLQIATVHMSKVFDSLDHNYLLTKLRRLGLMQSAAASWFSSYLLFRKQSQARCLSQKYFL